MAKIKKQKVFRLTKKFVSKRDRRKHELSRKKSAFCL